MGKILAHDKLIIFFLMFSTGLASLLYEVVLISVVTTVVGATEISLSLVLAAFLCGLAFGALFGGFVAKRLMGTENGLAYALMGIEAGVALFGFSFLSFLSLFVSSGMGTQVVFLVILAALFIPTVLMGMEIPIAIGALEKRGNAQSAGFVYFSDTLGGVLGSLIAGTVLIPVLGFHGAMYFGALLNVMTLVLATRLIRRWKLFWPAVAAVAAGIVVLAHSTATLQEWKLHFMDSFYGVGSAYYSVYYTTPLFSVQSPYQYIVVLESPFYGRQLLLDGYFQTSERGSLEYHEYLVMPAIAAVSHPERVLLIGGGDGGALYQILKFNISTIEQVDLDEEVVRVSKEYLPGVHRGSLDDPRVKRHIGDGRQFLRNAKDGSYDVIIIDLPDPTKLALAPLYSQEFYREVRRVLKEGGVVVTQFTPPYHYIEGFASEYKTIKSVFPQTYPYVVSGSLQSSFGYIIAGKSGDPRVVRTGDVGGKWYDNESHVSMFDLPPFIDRYLADAPVQVTTDENPIIHTYMQNNYFYRGVADEPYREAEGT
ncbi:fused MFS/spermidine synthase [Candidatus Woesearchaeota archaeon]|nr:fused MFS/spermidine synthase [Candidatus Woesearchaeota archaeon]